MTQQSRKVESGSQETTGIVQPPQGHYGNKEGEATWKEPCPPNLRLSYSILKGTFVHGKLRE